jgi:hypothetical protein
MGLVQPPNPHIVNRYFDTPVPVRAKIVNVQPTGDEGTAVYVTFDDPVFLKEKLTDEGIAIPELELGGEDGPFTDGICYDQPDPMTLDVTFPVETYSRPWSINTQPDCLKTKILVPAHGYVETLEP